MASSQAPIFICGRVRSGTTLLWQIYHRLPGYRAFYQPCHDNLLAHIDHTRPMASHHGVDDYWAEFRPLRETLGQRHRPAFGLTRMLLEADDDWPELRDYLQFLIDQCGGERPVLQFNAMCWRLPWLRRQFPDARIVHVWREPRDQWFSMVRHLPADQWDEPNLADAYDLLQWSSDLAPHLPFLFDADVTTSYARAYYLWRLSRLAGDRVADHVVAFNAGIQDAPDATLRELVGAGLLRASDVEAARQCIVPTRTGQWAEHRSAPWCEAIEQTCERKLQALGLVDHFGGKPLASIRAECAGAWQRCNAMASSERALRAMLESYSAARGECTRLLSLVHEVEGKLARCRAAEPTWQRMLRTARWLAPLRALRRRWQGSPATGQRESAGSA